MGVLEDTKILLQIDTDTKDEILRLYIEDVNQAIKSYCRIEFIPRQLESLIPMIAARLYNAGLDNVEEISEGDRKIRFFGSPTDVLGGFDDRLLPFINRRGVLPSEVVRNE